MLKNIYLDTLGTLMKRPIRLWGISLLMELLAVLSSLLTGVIPLVDLVITALLSAGMSSIYLRALSGKEVESLDLFDCFRDFATAKRVACGMGWKFLWIFIWGLIPIVGIVFAVIRAYEYRLTLFILINEPDVSATDAIKVSKERTMGYKSTMFWADVLPAVAVVIVAVVVGLFAAIPYIGVIFGVVEFLFLVAVIALVGLFYGLLHAKFYLRLTFPPAAAAPYAEAPAASAEV